MLPQNDDAYASSPKKADHPQGLLGKKGVFVKRSLKRRAEGIDFFRLAAALANPKNTPEQSGSGTDEQDDDLHQSELLDASFQDASPMFCATTQPWRNVAINHALVTSACAKWSELFGDEIVLSASSLIHQDSCGLLFSEITRPVQKRGVWFSKEEFAVLLSSIADSLLVLALKHAQEITSAKEFHEQVSTTIKDDATPWILVARDQDHQEAHFLITRARQFSSLRLHMKSLQVTSGADPQVRYVHLGMRSGENRDSVNCFYWLRFDENQQVQAGDFIMVDETTYLPKKLFRPHDFFTSIITGQHETGFSFSKHFATVELLKMYLDSVG